jgi:hypothetical protein
MVSLTSLLRKIFGNRKQPSSKADSLPPPYDCHCPAEQVSAITEKDSPLLNPALQFTATEIEAHLIKKDRIFAAAVIELVLPRLRLGVWCEPVGWGHYSYTLDKVFYRL